HDYSPPHAAEWRIISPESAARTGGSEVDCTTFQFGRWRTSAMHFREWHDHSDGAVAGQPWHTVEVGVPATPLAFVGVVQEAVKFFRVAGPLDHPVEPLDGTAG